MRCVMKRRFWILVFTIIYWWDSIWTQECRCLWLPSGFRPCSGCWSRQLAFGFCCVGLLVLVLLVCWVFLLLASRAPLFVLLTLRVRRFLFGRCLIVALIRRASPKTSRAALGQKSPEIATRFAEGFPPLRTPPSLALQNNDGAVSALRGGNHL